MSSKPNIFILNNRWDCSAGEPEFMDEQVRQQHLDRNLEFLCNELQVVDKQEGLNRVYFVSAKEVLLLRVKGRRDSGGALAEGYMGRLAEFESFEKAFEECISSHALKTKFCQPAQTGLDVSGHLQLSLNTFQTETQSLRQQREKELLACRERTIVLRRETDICVGNWSRKIQEMRSRSQEQVANGVSDEIHHLWSIVDQYDSPAGFNPESIDKFKQELCEHISVRLGQHLLDSCSQQLSEDCVAIQRDMFSDLQRVFPPSLELPSASSFVRPNFRVSHEMDIAHLCSDFQPDMRFRFRFGWTSMMHWLSGQRRDRFSLSAVPDLMRRASAEQSNLEAGGVDRGGSALPVNVEAVQQTLELTGRVASQAPWLVLGVGVLLWKVVGWKVMTGGLGIYGAMYGYERLCWTNRAKERVFKEQMVGFATDKLKVAVSFISSSCSSQVQQQLSSCKEQLWGELNTAQSNLQRRRVLLEHQIAQLAHLEHETHQQANMAGFAKTGFRKFLTDDLGLSSSAISQPTS